MATAASLQFIPVEVAPAVSAGAGHAEVESVNSPDIHIELNRGATRLSVRWPSTQATACAAWLRELAAVALKD